MSVRISRKMTTIPLVLATLLLAAGCAHPAHPDREPTRADVEAGTACTYAVTLLIVWKEPNREYVGKNGACVYAK